MECQTPNHMMFHSLPSSMRILLTGATGYIGQRLLPALVQEGHTVVCCTRDKDRFAPPESLIDRVEVVEVDFLEASSLDKIPPDIDGAYYLMHSMSGSTDYQEKELRSAENFRKCLDGTSAKHVVYLSGIINDDNLSEHLSSRKQVELELGKGSYNFTTLRAAIIIGSGSASFEIIRDLVEKLPVMIAPKWLNTRCQPIGIRDVISFLTQTLFNKDTINNSFDIGGPDILTYREMLLGYASARGLKRAIGIVPVMTPRLSSYWLYFVTSTSYPLAVSLVDSMKVEVICRNNDINLLLGINPISYEQALQRTLQRIDENQVVSSWTDSLVSSQDDLKLSEFLKVPVHGCFIDERQLPITNREATVERIWRIGGQTGWYYADTLWKIRGYLDKLFGGVGLRRGRTHVDKLDAGDALDFWRVLYANKEEGRLLLFAEMKLPGEAWLEFKVRDRILIQKATFRPKGVAGRMYWYGILPFHGIVFNGMINSLVE